MRTDLTPDFEKGGGLLPAIVQDARTLRVLMQAYMNEEALATTRKTGKVTFFSRSKNRLWTKGESSGNFLLLKEVRLDCDQDSLLILAEPMGPACHTGSDTCWGEENRPAAFLSELDALVAQRKAELPEGSYTTSLFQKGISKSAQKVGEEATEVVIEAIKGDRERLVEESADLLYHLTVVLHASDCSLAEVEEILRKRHNSA